MEILERILTVLIDLAFGDKGFKVITDSNPATGQFYALRAVNGKIILGGDTKSASGDNPIANHVIENGDILHGNFHSVQRADSSDVGAVIYAYRRVSQNEKSA